jgi:hypothetical protein
MVVSFRLARYLSANVTPERGAGGRQYGTSEKDKQTLTGKNNTSTARLGTVEECSFKLAGSSEFARIVWACHR